MSDATRRLADELTDDELDTLVEMVQARNEGRLTRREVVKSGGLLAALGLGGGAAVGSATADASTSDSDGNIGEPGNRVDAFVDGVDATSVDTESVDIAGQAHTGFFAPFYLLDDFGDDAVVNRAGSVNSAYVNPEEPASQSRYRPSWNDASDVSVTNGELIFPGGSFQNINVPTSFANGAWEVRWRWTGGSAVSTDYFRTELKFADGNNRLTLYAYGDGTLELLKKDGGTETVLISTTYAVDGNNQTFKVERSYGEEWELFVDSVSKGTASDTYFPSSGTLNLIHNGPEVAVEFVEVK